MELVCYLFYIAFRLGYLLGILLKCEIMKIEVIFLFNRGVFGTGAPQGKYVL